MITSATTLELTKALIGFHKEVRKIKKDKENTFLKSSYASLSNMLDTVDEPLLKNGLTFVQFPCGSNSLNTRLMHESGEWIEDFFTMTPTKNDPQGTGSALTYMRRYALGAILGLNIEEDDDGNAASRPESLKSKPEAANYKALLEATRNLTDLQRVWSQMPGKAKNLFQDLKDDLKLKFQVNESK